MIYGYKSNENDFTYDGKALPLAYDVVVTRDTSYYVSGKYPLDEAKTYKLLKEGYQIKVHTPQGQRIFALIKPVKHDTYIEFEAWPLFLFRMRNKQIKPLSITNGSGQVALTAFMNGLKTPQPQFSLTSNISGKHDYNTQDTNDSENDLYDAIDVFQAIVSRWQGEVDFNDFDIRMLDRIGENSGALLHEEKNISEYVDETSVADLVTRIYAISEWEDEDQNKHKIEVTVDSPLINSYDGIIYEKQYRNNDIKTEAELRAWANLKFSTDNMDKPKRNISVGTNIINGTSVSYGDTLVLNYVRHDIDMEIKVVGYTYDGYSDKYLSVELGSPKLTMSDTISNKISDVESNVSQKIKTTQEIIVNDLGKKIIHGGLYPDGIPQGSFKKGDTWFTDDGKIYYYDEASGSWLGSGVNGVVQEIETAISDNEQATQDALETANQGVAKANQNAIDVGLAGQTADEALANANNALGQLPAIKGDVSGLQTSLTNEVLPNLKTTVDGQQVYLKTVVDQDHASLETTMAKVDGNTTQIGDLNANYSGLSAQFGDFETEFDNLETDGRNVILNSELTTTNYDNWSYNPTNVYQEANSLRYRYTVFKPHGSGSDRTFFLSETRLLSDAALKTGDEVVLSLNIYGRDTTRSDSDVRIRYFNSDGNIIGDYNFISFKDYLSGNKPVRAYSNGTIPENAYSFQVIIGSRDWGKYMQFSHIKFGKNYANKIWSPAPEDLTTIKQFSEFSLDVDRFKTSFQDYTDSNDSKWATYSESATGWNADIAQINKDIDTKATTTALNSVKATAEGNSSSIAKLRTDVDGKATIQQYNTLKETVDGNVTTIGDLRDNKADQLTVTEMANQFNVLVANEQSLTANLLQNTGSMYNFDYWRSTDTSVMNLYTHPTLQWATIRKAKNVDARHVDLDLISSVTLNQTLTFIIRCKTPSRSDLSFWVDFKDSTGDRVGDAFRVSVPNTPVMQTIKYSITATSAKTAQKLSLISSSDLQLDDIIEIEYMVLVRGDTSDLSYRPASTDKASQAQLSVLSDQINLRVKSGEIIRQLNLSTEGLLIDAGKVQITGETYIQNGVIKNAMIADASISTAKIADASITNAKIVNLDVSKLSAGIIDANKIKMRATASGKSIEMDGNGISGWDSNGKLRMKWGIQDLAGDGQSSPANLLFYTGNGTKSVSAGTNVDDLFVLGTESSTVDGLLRFPRKLTIQSTDLYLAPQNLTTKPWHIRASQDGSDQPMIYADTPNTGILGHSSYYLKDVFTYNGYIRKLNVGFGSGAPQEGDLAVNSDGAGAYVRSMAAYNRTYSSGPTMSITSYGTLGRLTSASKYKLDITPVDNSLNLANNILKLNPKKWFDKEIVEDYAETLTKGYSGVNDERLPIKRSYGLIAEDLEKAGLSMFCHYNKNGEVEGIEYDRLWTVLIPLIKEQQSRIEKLEKLLGVA